MTAAASLKSWTGAVLAAPVVWLASIANPPLKAWQRATGTGGMAAFFLAPNMAIFGIFILAFLISGVASFFILGGSTLAQPSLSFLLSFGVVKSKAFARCASEFISFAGPKETNPRKGPSPTQRE